MDSNNNTPSENNNATPSDERAEAASALLNMSASPSRSGGSCSGQQQMPMVIQNNDSNNVAAAAAAVAGDDMMMDIDEGQAAVAESSCQVQPPPTEEEEQQALQQPLSPSEKKQDDVIEPPPNKKSPEKTPRKLTVPSGAASELKHPPELLLDHSSNNGEQQQQQLMVKQPTTTAHYTMEDAPQQNATAETETTAASSLPLTTKQAKKKKMRSSKTTKTLQRVKESVAVTQFLSSQPQQQRREDALTSDTIMENTDNTFNRRIDVSGNILDIAHRITDGGEETPVDTGSSVAGDVASFKSDEEATAATATATTTNDNNIRNNGMMDGIMSITSQFPTMAPPMSFVDDTNLEDAVYGSFMPTVGKKKRRRRQQQQSTVNNNHDESTTTNSTSRTKKKKGRKRKSEEGGSGNTNNNAIKRSDSNKSTDITTNNPLLSQLEQQRTYYQDVRVLPDPTPKFKSHVIRNDPSPQRISNPLLTLPLYPPGHDPALEDIPTGGELWNMADIRFCDPDTYPISYLGRVLGFDIPEAGVGCPFGGGLDVDTLSTLNEKEDPWMVVPEVGHFVNQVWKRKNGAEDDAVLSYMDPLYANILQTYRGYNGTDFIDAGKGYAEHLSPLIMEFAKERGIVNNNDVSFRMATSDDEAALTALEGKCQSKCVSKIDLATFLKTPGKFCIIGESADKVPVAFVQYSFCWYKVEEKKIGTNQMTSYGVKSRAGETVDKVSELVFFIDNVIFDESIGGISTDVEEGTNSIKLPDVETIRVLLVSLALIHAWGHNIWYGMMESPSSLVTFYERYFRMITVGKQESDPNQSKNAVVPLVCDLKKCSFRYAIHLREEDLKSKQQSQSSTADHSSIIQRMLVHMPSASDAIKVVQNSSEDKESGTSLSNAIRATQAKQVQVRITNASAIENTTPEIHSVSAVDGQETSTILDVSTIGDIPTNWNAFKLFDTKSQTPMSNTVSGSNDDFLLAHLIQKQKELKSLESSIENTSRSLLKKAYDDALDFQLGDRKTNKEHEKQVLKDFEKVKQRLHEADMAWQAQLEQDMDAVCDVCWDGEVTPENQIIFCDACNVAVHQGCYGIDKVPSGNYFCHTCIYNGKNNEFLAAERREGPRSAPTRTPVICELCPRRQGAFVQCYAAEDSLRKPRWVHVSCAKWCGLNYIDPEKKDMIEDVAPLKQDYRNLGITCALCDSGIGGMIECRVKGCRKWLHLTCARCVGTCSVQHGENCEGLYPPDAIPFPAWSLACIEHSEVDPESIRKNSITVEQLKAIAKSYPPEPEPPKPFTKMSNKERREYWSDRDNLEAFFLEIKNIKSCAFCSICCLASCDEQCDKCGTFFHAGCVGTSGKCHGCQYAADKAGPTNYTEPKCKLCHDSQGPLLETSAKPVSMKKWNKNKAAFNRSLFGPNNFCHVLCGL
eukprot:scaffold1804_cov66-Cyclotella_meneghiniana.AAC.8